MSRPSASILEHLHAPRNAGILVNFQVIGRADLEGRAPRIAIYLEIAGDLVQRASFQAFGCGYSIACCSVLTELVSGRSLVNCREISALDVESVLGGLPSEKQFCAELAVAAFHNGLALWTNQSGENHG
ncbi:MAG: iron-sulfur cluster assembly scaffold protein [Planctomycetes bacterium]|nr:iron-sulfur cluster assembly scaffold protein [Planctomycetota bacterium]